MSSDDELIYMAAAELNDPGHRRWSFEFLEGALAGAKQKLALAIPDVTRTHATLRLEAGSRQSIPAEGLRLIEVLHNIRPDDSAGRSVRYANRRLLERFDPDWRSRDASDRIEQYTWDDQEPRIFHTIPPAVSGTEVAVVYAREPSDMPLEGVFTQYADALRMLVLAQAHRLNTSEVAITRARDYEQAFYQAIGVRNEARAQESRPQTQRQVSNGSD